MTKNKSNLTPEELRALGLRYLFEEFAGADADQIARLALQSPEILDLGMASAWKILSDDETDAIYASVMRRADELRIQNAPAAAPPTRPISPTISSALQKLGKGVEDLVERWSGCIAAWDVRPTLTGQPLSDNAGMTPYVAVEADPCVLFPQRLLDEGLQWVRSPLCLMATQDADGSIRSLRATIGTVAQPIGTGVIIVELADAEGRSVALVLSAARPSMVNSSPQLRGPWPELTVRIYSSEVN